MIHTCQLFTLLYVQIQRTLSQGDLPARPEHQYFIWILRSPDSGVTFRVASTAVHSPCEFDLPYHIGIGKTVAGTFFRWEM